ncbi:erythromycin esterase family protein [Streptomyces sp. NPDC006551]|uniref:erythromycin esterase family protein n=1 Tax=Streptomyces sp. NPDC006551 TaxID=3157178 RepID=UPI0033A66758
MADAVGTVLEDPSTRIALWAHNGHISKGRYGGGVPALGQHLHSRYGDAYYALGLLLGSGSFRARRTWPGPWSRPRARAAGSNRIGAARAGSIEARLATANPGNHLVDLRSAADAPTTLQAWLDGRHGVRSFGAMVPRWTYRLHQGLFLLGRGVRRAGLHRGLVRLPASPPLEHREATSRGSTPPPARVLPGSSTRRTPVSLDQTHRRTPQSAALAPTRRIRTPIRQSRYSGGSARSYG